MKKMKTLKEAARGGGITERYNVRAGQMFHLNNGYNHNCVFCGNPAIHRFKAQTNTASIYLCTKHMVQFFHLKPNRMPPRPKAEHVSLPESLPREYRLTRTMHKPVEFFGKKLVCYDAGEIMGYRYFFTLYNAFRTENSDGAGFYLSITAYAPTPTFKDGTKAKSKGKTLSMHFVVPCELLGLNDFIKEGVEWFVNPERCHPGNAQMLRVLLEGAATKFIGEVHNRSEEILNELESAEIGG